MQLEILSMKHFSWIIGGVKHHPPRVVYFAVLELLISHYKNASRSYPVKQQPQQNKTAAMHILAVST